MKHTIIVNGLRVEVDAEQLTYEQIVAMVYQPSCTFYHGKDKVQGCLSKGQVIDIVDGLVISCIQTGNA